MEQTAILVWALIPMLFFALFVFPAFRLKRAIYKVIKIFRRQESSCFKGVKGPDELGLRPSGLLDGILRFKDFKVYALQVLMKEDVVWITDDDRLCLKEEKAREFMQKYGL